MGEYYKEIMGLIKGNSCEAKKFRDSEDRFLFFEELFEKTLDTERITNEVVRHVTRELEERNLEVGIPVSALMNLSPEKEFEIETKRAHDYMGAWIKRKSVTINGDVGNWLADGTDGGKIVVKGNAGNFAGSEANGEVVIEGDAGNYAGAFLDGGILVIKGRTGAETGYMMKQGEIYVAELDLNNLSMSMRDGSIYRGLPTHMQGDPEPVWVLRILKSSDDEVAFFYFSKKNSTSLLAEKINYVLTTKFLHS